jgi:hypothetical protein
MRLLILALDSILDGLGTLAGDGGGTLDLRRQCHGDSPESGQQAATELGLLRCFALRDRGDEGVLLRLPRGSGKR